MGGESTTVVDPLAATARWTAAVRARETERDDRLFSDPWARDLAGPEGAAWIASRTPDSTVPIAIRTRYFDDWLTACGVGHGLGQFVLLGAGLDTRAFRLDWPTGTRLYELDRGPVLAAKARVLEAAGADARCARRAIAVDLATPWANDLLAAGFESATPTAWLLEGFLFYLSREAIALVLGEVSRLAAPASRIGFDIINGLVLDSPWTSAWVQMQAAAGAPWVGTMDDPVHELDRLGWTAALTQPGAPDASYGRWTLPVIPPTMPGLPHSWYVTAERRPA